MHIKSILSGAAIALAAAVGSASAADQLSTLKGIAADVMTPQEMGVVKGMAPTATIMITHPKGKSNANASPPAFGQVRAFSDEGAQELFDEFGAGTFTKGARTFVITGP